MIKGLCVSPGFIKAKARVIKSHDDLESVEFGEILVLPESNPIYALAVMKAAGLICENGGRLSHICVVAMEMGIPCATQVLEATQKITSGQYISLDADQGEIWIDG
jgi:phosphohistidine swiveling domain-containing protein